MQVAMTLCFAALTMIMQISTAPAADHTKDKLSEIKKNIDDEKAVLVDVREKTEWQEGHIKGALFLPLSAVQDGLTEQELKQLPKEKVLYVHCVVGARALTAANALEKHGYKVRPMKPGYKEMVSAGFPKSKR